MYVRARACRPKVGMCLVMMMMMGVWRVMMVSDSQVCRPVLVNKERVHPEVKQVAIRHIARPVK